MPTTGFCSTTLLAFLQFLRQEGIYLSIRKSHVYKLFQSLLYFLVSFMRCTRGARVNRMQFIKQLIPFLLWKTAAEWRSPSYTTNWNQLPRVS